MHTKYCIHVFHSSPCWRSCLKFVFHTHRISLYTYFVSVHAEVLVFFIHTEYWHTVWVSPRENQTQGWTISAQPCILIYEKSPEEIELGGGPPVLCNSDLNVLSGRADLSRLSSLQTTKCSLSLSFNLWQFSLKLHPSIRACPILLVMISTFTFYSLASTILKMFFPLLHDWSTWQTQLV